MATDQIGNLPSGSNVFIDANILIYGLEGSSAECRTFLERCSREEIIGVTSFHIVGEVTHRLMCLEATKKGLTAKNKARDFLSKHPKAVMGLSGYWTDTERLLALNLLFVSVAEGTVRGAQPERAGAGLLNNDSLLVACMRECGLSFLASNDSAFDRVSNLIVFRPSDVRTP